jgi:serine phosphatase RsbU (regulator of sigma subunit)
MENFRIRIRICLFSCLFSLISISAFAYYSKLDSLKALVSKHSVVDTGRVNLLLSICKESLTQVNYKEKLQLYAPQALSLSYQQSFKHGIAYAFYYMSLADFKKPGFLTEEEYTQKALKLMQELKDKRGAASCYERLGRINGTNNKYQKAVQFYLNAIVLKRELKDLNGAADSYSWIAGIYLHTGDYEHALEYCLKGLKIAEATGYKNKICESNITIGIIFYEQKKYKECIAYMGKALAVEGEQTSKRNLAFIYNNMAIAYEALKDHNTALSYHFKSLKLKEGSSEGTAISYNNISAVYASLGKSDEALRYILKSVALSEKINDRVGLTYSYIGAGDCYKEQRNTVVAYNYYLKGLKIAREINYKTEIREAYDHLSSVCEEMKDYHKALEYHKQYAQIKDSILNEESLQQSSELNIRYETEKKEKEILLLTKDQELKNKNLKEQRLIRIGLIVGLGLLFALSFLLFNRYRFKQKANLLLEKQKEEIHKKNTLITDSIDYAKTIQEAVLPDETCLSALLPDHFILYKPKDIVSGDFYWITKKENKIICAVADCTGHGVPGAFMSLLGHNMLENSVQLETSVNPGTILTAMNQQISARFSKGREESKHGMDIAIISIDTVNHQLEYAGAKNAVYIIRENQLLEIKADKVALGTPDKDLMLFNYTNHVFHLQQDDMIYLFSDGFPDQKGGPEKKKFFYQPFKNLLVSISALPLGEQKERLNSAITEWLGAGEQIDDILVMGIKYGALA